MWYKNAKGNYCLQTNDCLLSVSGKAVGDLPVEKIIDVCDTFVKSHEFTELESEQGITRMFGFSNRVYGIGESSLTSKTVLTGRKQSDAPKLAITLKSKYLDE
jgi:hypothetical protein